MQDSNLNRYPVLIEYKGYQDKLVKLDSHGQVDNRSKTGPNFKNINSFAVNGAVHYANALLHHTSYTDIIAIGMTGYRDDNGNIQHKIGVYFVSKSNLGVGQKIGDFADLSFLAKENFDAFIAQVKALSLTAEEIEQLNAQREKEIDLSLVKLNNDIYQNEKGLGENDRVYLVAASIIATLGVPGKVAPLEKSDLKSSTEKGNTDGDILMRKIRAFLDEKALPKEKKDLIERTLQNTLTTDNINKVINGESQLKRVFVKIVDDLGIYYKIGLTTDFTGKLFNEMYGWLGFTQDKLNDVVLTPSYVASLLVKLARVNKDSYVWDFATGSAGLLVAAMNEMLADAKKTIASPDELRRKEAQIKAEQLLGLELLSSVYMLAVLNMILMGDGSSKILNKDSLKDFDGHHESDKEKTKFPADAFILNPPYSAKGNGMNFVEKALGMMSKGYAAIIIQNSAGSGKAREYNQRILQKNTLIASIKMPIDLFIGKSSVQTNVYVFKVGESHHPDETVKFIDFSNDGYTRTNRKKASNNLKDTDRARQRYEEVVNLVRFGKSKLKIFTNKEYYEGRINPEDGTDWNQAAPIDTKPTLADFKKTVGDYLSWKVNNLLNRQHENLQSAGLKAPPLTTEEENALKAFEISEWGEFSYGSIFNKVVQGRRLKKDDQIPGETPFVMAGTTNAGIVNYVSNPVATFPKNSITVDIFGNVFYRDYDFGAGDDTGVYWNDEINYSRLAMLFIATSMQKSLFGKFSFGKKLRSSQSLNFKIHLPTKNNQPDYTFMETLISAIQKLVIKDEVDYVSRRIAAYKSVISG